MAKYQIDTKLDKVVVKIYKNRRWVTPKRMTREMYKVVRKLRSK